MKKIHMTYKKKIPPFVQIRWKVLNPTYTVELSLDNDCFNFLKKAFNSDVALKFMTIPRGMYKADLWRLCKLYMEGGVYADVDLVPYLNLDSLDPDVFYTCLATDPAYIFQAFMMNQRPKSPLILVFLLSLLYNNPYTMNNGPCFDMCSCLRYNIGEALESDKEYIIRTPKFRVDVPSNSNHLKYIDLVYFPTNMDYFVTCSQGNFSFKIIKNMLIVRNNDKRGWDTPFHVHICFRTEQRVLLFQEVDPGHMKYCHVKYRNKKILDSRDPLYFDNRGW